MGWNHTTKHILIFILCVRPAKDLNGHNLRAETLD